jgi:hypothetical protein
MSDHINARVTPEDVLANKLGLADEETESRIAEARLRNDPELARLEERLGIKPGESEEFDIAAEDVPASIARLLAAQRAKLRDQQHGNGEKVGSLWATFAIASGRSARPPADIIPSEKLFATDSGALLYATTVLAAADDNAPSATPLEIPCVFADYAKDRLTIRQPLESVPTGVVQLVVLRRFPSSNQADILYSQRLELERTSRPGKGAYWYGEVSLSSIGQINAGDDLIYCVDPERNS